MATHASDTLRTTFKSDDELMEAVQDRDIEYENNHWTEAFDKKPDGCLCGYFLLAGLAEGQFHQGRC